MNRMGPSEEVIIALGFVLQEGIRIKLHSILLNFLTFVANMAT